MDLSNITLANIAIKNWLYKSTILALLALAVFAVIFVFLLKPNLQELHLLKVKQKQLKFQVDQFKTLQSQYKKLVSLKQIKLNVASAEIMTQFTKIGTQLHLKIRFITPETAKKLRAAVVYPVNLAINGGYHAVAKFIDLITTKYPMLYLNTLNFKTLKQKVGRQQNSSMVVRLQWFVVDVKRK